MKITQESIRTFFYQSAKATIPIAAAALSAFAITALMHVRRYNKPDQIYMDGLSGLGSAMLVSHIVEKKYIGNYGKIGKGISKISCVAFAFLGVILGLGLANAINEPSTED